MMKYTKAVITCYLLVSTGLLARAPLDSSSAIEELLKSTEEKMVASDEGLALPWQLGEEDSGDRTHIYIPDNFDYHLIRERMSGSGFGPGNGGNKYIFEVDSMVKKIIANISANRDAFPEIDIDSFKSKVKKIGVFFLDSLPTNDERTLAALNFSKEQAIIIQKAQWEKMSYQNKIQLILHEYLGVLRIEKENATISGRLSNFMGAEKSFESFEPTDLKWLYSRSSTESFINRFNFSSDHTGEVTSLDGRDSFKWILNNNTVYLKLSGELTIKRVSYEKYPDSDYAKEVHISTTDLDLEISKVEPGFFKLKRTSKVCKKFVEKEPILEVCTFETSSQDQLVGTHKIESGRIRLYEGDYIALPLLGEEAENQSTIQLIELKSDDQVKIINGYARSNISKWNLDKKALHYETEDGESYSLKIIKKQNGINRVLIEVNKDGREYVRIEAMAIVKEGELPTITRKDAVGDFLPIYAGAHHTAEDYSPYIFDEDGMGGFTTFFGSERNMNHWSWLVDNGQITARQHYILESSSYPRTYVRTREELETCLTMSTGCEIFQERDYIILNKKGHRYTMLRLLRHNLNHSDQEGGNISLSSGLWVMDKL